MDQLGNPTDVMGAENNIYARQSFEELFALLLGYTPSNAYDLTGFYLFLGLSDVR